MYTVFMGDGTILNNWLSIFSEWTVPENKWAKLINVKANSIT